MDIKNFKWYNFIVIKEEKKEIQIMNYRRNIKELRDVNLCEYGCFEEVGFFDSFIKDGAAYLTVAKAVGWDGSDGYKIDYGKENVFSRSYDAEIFPVDVSVGGKILRVVESSHDVPTGSATYVVALTKREAAFVETLLARRDFERIDDFLEENIARLEQ